MINANGTGNGANGVNEQKRVIVKTKLIKMV